MGDPKGSDYAHGFMNLASKAFAETGYRQQLSELLKRLADAIENGEKL